VAREHYLQVTQEHFERAAGLSDRAAEAAQNPTQQMHTEPCTASHPVSESAEFDVKRDPARQCEAPVGRVGHEPPPLTASKTLISDKGDAKSDARDAPNPVQDPDLTSLVKVWPDLPEHIKAAIKALVQTHIREGA